jgi:hypothetical protein
MPKNVLPHAIVWGGVADDPVYVDAANPVPVGGPALDLIDADLDTLNAQMASLVSAATAPVTDMPHDALDALLDLANDMLVAIVNFNSTSDQSVIAATAGQSIRVHRGHLWIPSAVNLFVYDGASANNLLLDPLSPPDKGQIRLPFDSRPHWQTTAGNALVIKASAAVQIYGVLFYKKS